MQPVIHERIERAFEQFKRGEFFFAEESRADMEKCKAHGWLSRNADDALQRFR